MTTCLNPIERHQATGGLVCATPNCGFLIAGAHCGNWRIHTMIRQSLIADLYLATPGDPAQTQKILVRVLRGAQELSTNVALHLQELLALRHPSIQTPFHGELIEEQNVILLATMLAEQGSLASIHHLPLVGIANTVRQIADALQFAHTRNIVHGHLKPENCLLMHQDSLQICDFYYAFFNGSARYVLPPTAAFEQKQGKIEPASDQFSLAAMSHTLISNYLAISLEGKLTTASQSSRAPLFTFTNPVDPVIQRGLHPLAGARYPTINSFAHALYTALSQTAPMLDRYTQKEASLLHASTSTPSSSLLSRVHFGLRKHATPDTMKTRNVCPNKSQPTTVIEHPTAQAICSLPGHTSGVNIVQWARDSTYLATASQDKNIRLWNIQHRVGKPLATLNGHSGQITALCWSPDKAHLLSASTDASICLWDTHDKSHINSQALATWWGHNGPIYALDWSTNGEIIASGGKDHILRLWSPSGQRLLSWQMPRKEVVKTLTWSPSNDMIAIGSSEKCILLWDMRKRQICREWENHGDAVVQLLWSGDGHYLISHTGKKDRRVFIWDTTSGKLVHILNAAIGTIVGVFVARNSNWLATVATDNTLRFWDMEAKQLSPVGKPLVLESMPQTFSCNDTGELIAISMANLSIVILQVKDLF